MYWKTGLLLLLSFGLQFALASNSVKNYTITCDSAKPSDSLCSEYDDCVVNAVKTLFCPSVSTFSLAFANCKWDYGKWGSLQIGGPFMSLIHPISLPPYSPEVLQPKFQLYTRNNPSTSFDFEADDITDIADSNYVATRKSIFLIGGLTNGDFEPYRDDFVNELLKDGDYNVFVINWYLGSLATYDIAVANTRMVALMATYFLKQLNTKTGLKYADCHLIGHSLGSHIAGHIGEALNGQIGRITGLDAAGPYYCGADKKVKLDPSDAAFVDVIHTNAGILPNLGINENIGHVDFWPNGGCFQRGCNPLEVMADPFFFNLVACNHVISIYYYMYSIAKKDNCTFSAFMCSGSLLFDSGFCNDCGSDGKKCAKMGHRAIEYKTADHQTPAKYGFYLDTGFFRPFCQN